MVEHSLQQGDMLAPHPETDADRCSRIEREKAIIAQAEAEIDAGLGLDGDDVEAWLNQLDVDPDAPLPMPRAMISLRG